MKTTSLLLLSTLLFLPPDLAGYPQQIVPREPSRQRDVVDNRTLSTQETERAIERGLAFLASSQNADGSFGSGGFFRRNVGVTALAGMSFLAAGHTPGRGKYGNQITQATEFILSRSKQNGYLIDPQSVSHGPMYGHGFATLFLAEVYGMLRGPNLLERRKRLKEVLERAVKLMVDSQNQDGGWRYKPESRDADVSVTVCQVMALRAAKNSGIYVPKTTIDASIRYIKLCQNPDGGFRYQLNSPRSSDFARSAASLVALYSAGIYEGRELEKGLDYVNRHQPRRQGFINLSHYFYGHYYAVQAMYHAGGTQWANWYPSIRDELLDRQSSRGSWTDPSICTEYGTAMSLLILQMPNNYLPIFQR